MLGTACTACSHMLLPRGCWLALCLLQARAQVEAAKQQLVLLEAEADGARIRGQAEAQAAVVRACGEHVANVVEGTPAWSGAQHGLKPGGVSSPHPLPSFIPCPACRPHVTVLRVSQLHWRSSGKPWLACWHSLSSGRRRWVRCVAQECSRLHAVHLSNNKTRTPVCLTDRCTQVC